MCGAMRTFGYLALLRYKLYSDVCQFITYYDASTNRSPCRIRPPAMVMTFGLSDLTCQEKKK